MFFIHVIMSSASSATATSISLSWG